MISDELKQRLAKVHELVKRGTDGEKAAAKRALDRILLKYNIDGVDIDSLNNKRYSFKYKTQLDFKLLIAVAKNFIDGGFDYDNTFQDARNKTIISVLTYLDYVTIEAAYGYFRKHMNVQWKKYCIPNLARCRTVKSRNKRRSELMPLFFSSYIIASELVQQDQLISIDLDKLSQKELKDRIRLGKVEGGKYNRQMTSGLLIEKQ